MLCIDSFIWFYSEFLIGSDYKLVTFDQFEFLKTFSTSTLAQISYVMNFSWMWNLIFEVFFSMEIALVFFIMTI